MSELKKTSIGGQALIEGVMMRGPRKTAMAVRSPEGEIQMEEWETASPSVWYKKAPFVRGIFNMVDTFRLGYKCLMRSAEIAGLEEEEDEEPSKLEKLLGDKFFSFLAGVAMVLGVLLAVGLFVVLPTLLVGLLRQVVEIPFVLTVVEGGSKILLFVGYLALVSRMKEIHRVFEYHGAEHKTIACYEAGEELTVENVAKHRRFHPRCGTSFLLIVVIVSILLSSLVSWDNVVIRVVLKILLLPVVVGVAYEIIKLAGRYDNILTRLVSAPGLWLQRLTTQEPDEGQMACAIAAMEAVIPEQEGEDRW